jgi:hypothetical protein
LPKLVGSAKHLSGSSALIWFRRPSMMDWKAWLLGEQWNDREMLSLDPPTNFE